MTDTKSSTSNTPGSSAQGSGSDTVSAAKISAGTSVGTAGQPPKPQDHSTQSSTLSSHTSRPLGGSAGATGAGASAGQGNQTHSRGPEHLRHQDKDAGQGLGAQRSSGAGSGSASQSSGSGSSSDTLRQAQDKAGEVYEEVSERAGELYEQATEWARDKYEQATEWASDQYDNRSRYMNHASRYTSQAGGTVQRFVRDNPVLVGVVGLAAGLLLGALLPRTRQEDRTFGQWSDELRDQGMRYARDMAHRGREYVEETFNDEDPRFASHDSEWRQDRGQDADRRSGPSGRFQNH